MGCYEGTDQEETFDFAVTSRTKRDVQIKYNLYIEKLEVDNDATALNDNDIALYLTDYSEEEMLLPHAYDCSNASLSSDDNTDFSQSNNPVDKYRNVKPTLLEASAGKRSRGGISLVSQLDNYKLYSNIHAHDSDHEVVQDKFKLRAWVIPDNVNAFNWNSSTKYQYKFKIGLRSDEYQIPSVVYNTVNGYAKIGERLNNNAEKRYCIIATDSHDETYNSCYADMNSMIYDTSSECETNKNNYCNEDDVSCECELNNIPSTLANEMQYKTNDGYCYTGTQDGVLGSSCNYGQGFKTLDECEAYINDTNLNIEDLSCVSGSWVDIISNGYTANSNLFILSGRKPTFVSFKHNLNSNGIVQSTEVCLRNNDGSIDACLKAGISNYSENKQYIENHYGISNCSSDTDQKFGELSFSNIYLCQTNQFSYAEIYENGDIYIRNGSTIAYLSDSFSYYFNGYSGGGGSSV